jgi:hypothetical protein
MGIGLNAGDTPELFKDKNGVDLPIESLQGADKTAYLKIDLKVNPMGGQPVTPMTAVFAPDPTKLTGTVDILLWLHGDKSYWDVTRTDKRPFQGKSIQYYLTLPLCKLREFILQTSKKRFLLVAPTLNDRTGISIGHGNHNPGGLRWNQADAEAYLQQVLNGVQKHLCANACHVGNVVLAAHSGGGHVQGQVAGYFSGKFDRMNEVWCFDSNYWGSAPFISWAKKGHSHGKLWVYSTGGTTNGTTGPSATDILKLTQPPPPPKPKHAVSKHHAVTTHTLPAAKVQAFIHDVGAVASRLLSGMLHPPTTKIEVLIHGAGKHGAPLTTDNFLATYGGSAIGHYEGMPKYLPKLVETSQNLK